MNLGAATRAAILMTSKSPDPDVVHLADEVLNSC